MDNSGISNAYFIQGIAQLMFYRTNHGNLDVADDYITGDRFPLGEFVADVRLAYKNKGLDEDQVLRLYDIGFAMDKKDQAWESMYVLAKNYFDTHKGKLPKVTERTADDVLIGAWIRKQRLCFLRMSDEKRAKLKEIGISA